MALPVRNGHVIWSDYRTRLPDGEPKVTWDDLLDFYEVYVTDVENERRAHAAAQRNAKEKR